MAGSAFRLEGAGGRGEGFEGGGGTEGEEKRESCFAVLLCCLWSVLFPLCV